MLPEYRGSDEGESEEELSGLDIESDKEDDKELKTKPSFARVRSRRFKMVQMEEEPAKFYQCKTITGGKCA